MVAPIKLDHKNYVQVKENFVRYTLFRKDFYSPRAKGHVKPSRFVYCLDFGDRLMLYKFTPERSKKGLQTTGAVVSIKVKDGKVTVYHKNANRVRNWSFAPSRIHEFLFSPFNTKRYVTCPKRRLNKILVNFLKRNGVKFRYDRKNWDVNLVKACYPGLRELELKKGDCLSPLESRYFRRKNTFKEVIKAIFGNSGKQITKCVAQRFESRGDFRHMQYGVLSKGLIPFDNVLRMVKEAGEDYDPLATVKNQELTLIRRVLRQYPVERRKILFSQRLDRSFHVVDIGRTAKTYANWRDCLPEKPANFEELHDEFVAKCRKKGEIKVEVFELGLLKNKRFASVDEYELDDLKIIVPKTNIDLIGWGKEMHNCIAGYASYVRDGQTQVLGVERKGKLIYNIEIANKALRQFYGPCNSEPDHKDIEKVLLLLQTLDIIENRDQRDALIGAVAAANNAPEWEEVVEEENRDGQVVRNRLILARPAMVQPRRAADDEEIALPF